MENTSVEKNKVSWSTVGRKTGTVVKYALLILFALIILLPLAWVILSSLKTRDEINNPFGFPTQFYFQNYIDAWKRAQMGSYFLNSIIVTAGSLLLLLILAVPCSYTLSRFKFRGSKVISLIFMSGLFININYIVLPLTTMFIDFSKLLGLPPATFNDNFFVVMVLYASTSLSFSIYLMNSYFKALSPSFEEAAKIDGCGYFKTFLYVCAPLALPSILTVILFNFLSFWNEYILASNFLPRLKTLPVGLLLIMREARTADNPGRMYAGLVIVMIPVLIVYSCVQGQLTKGITVGGVKG